MRIQNPISKSAYIKNNMQQETITNYFSTLLSSHFFKKKNDLQMFTYKIVSKENTDSHSE